MNIDIIYHNGWAEQKDKSLSVVYDQEYFKKFMVYATHREQRLKIHNIRESMTNKYLGNGEMIIDYGCGDCHFIVNHTNKNIYGFDINPYSIDCLLKLGLYINPFTCIWGSIQGICFWDSLEHLINPAEILSKLSSRTYVFISVPIFDDLANIKGSRHYRPYEHYYYFTKDGLIGYMHGLGFTYLDNNNFESLAGRDNIQNFVFRKN